MLHTQHPPTEAEILAQASPEVRREFFRRRDAMRSSEDVSRMIDRMPEPQSDDEWRMRSQWTRATRSKLHAQYRRERVRQCLTRSQEAALFLRPVTMERPREHRSTSKRRTASSSSTSSADPGDPDADSDGDGLRHVSIPLADELNRIADRLRARGGVG